MKFQCTSDHSNADVLSRVPMREIPVQTETPAELVLIMEHNSEEILTCSQFTLFTAWLANQTVQLFFQKYQTFSTQSMHTVVVI